MPKVIGIKIKACLVVLTSNITDRNGVAAGLAAFLSPLIGLVIVLCSSTSERRAVINGESGEYKKCPFCAEPIRKEAVKCKHSGSEIGMISGRVNIIDITDAVVMVSLNGASQIDDFKVKQLAERIKNNSNDVEGSLLEMYRPQLDVIATSLPISIREEFRDRIAFWLA